jgi:hypothetical protein
MLGGPIAGGGGVPAARRRIQQIVDRRFNRRRHDTAQTIAAFSARLREQVDLNTLTGELLMASEATMQPAQASLWLRSQGRCCIRCDRIRAARLPA